MIVIYTRSVTHRLRYILDTVFLGYFGLNYMMVTDPGEAPEHTVRINYSGKAQPGWFSVFREPLLFEQDIREQRIFISRESGIPVIFQTTDNFDLRYDVFSAAFYLLSRYEEYLPHDTDEHGRYRSANSLLSNPAFDMEPVVEYWLHDFKKRLLERYPEITFKTLQASIEYTFDIDQAFAFAGRRWPKILGSLAKREGRQVLFHGEQDPYDTIARILDFLDKRQSRARLFFLLNDRGKNSSSVDPKGLKLIRQIRDCACSHEVALHPSYDALDTESIYKEKVLLERHTGQEVTHSRQHFLRIRFPDYFRNLEAAGITHDHSLGYPDRPGFRAGFSRPFRFYDLLQDRPTKLWIHPFTFMDATWMYYQKVPQTQIITKILQIGEQVSKVNGKLVTVSHNDLLADSCPVDFWEVLKNCAV